VEVKLDCHRDCQAAREVQQAGKYPQICSTFTM
jgi:hypothetical protein